MPGPADHGRRRPRRRRRPGDFPDLKAEAKVGGRGAARRLGWWHGRSMFCPAPTFRSAPAASARAVWPRLRRSRGAHAGSGGLRGPRRRRSRSFVCTGQRTCCTWGAAAAQRGPRQPGPRIAGRRQPSGRYAYLHGFLTNLVNLVMVTFAWRSCRSSWTAASAADHCSSPSWERSSSRSRCWSTAR